jgi:hypothetical protein
MVVVVVLLLLLVYGVRRMAGGEYDTQAERCILGRRINQSKSGVAGRNEAGRRFLLLRRPCSPLCRFWRFRATV